MRLGRVSLRLGREQEAGASFRALRATRAGVKPTKGQRHAVAPSSSDFDRFDDTTKAPEAIRACKPAETLNNSSTRKTMRVERGRIDPRIVGVHLAILAIIRSIFGHFGDLFDTRELILG